MLLKNLVLSFLVVAAHAVVVYRKLERRIVNGTAASIDDYPFMVSIQEIHNDKAYHMCGGSILSEHWVLTAAHCLEDFSPEDIVVEFGKSKITKTLNGKIKAIDVIINEGFDTNTVAHDIGLVKTESIQISDKFKVELPSRNQLFTTGMDATAIGWGKLASNKPISYTLQKVDLVIYDYEECDKIHGGKGHVQEFNICTKGGLKGVCRGDSGGPLMANSVQVGIVSWGSKTCADPESADVYAFTVYYLDWIKNITEMYQLID